MQAIKDVGTPTGNMNAVNILSKNLAARTPEQRMNILKSVVSDDFLLSQSQPGKASIDAFIKKFINGDKEVVNLFHANIDPNKLKKVLSSHMSNKEAYEQYLIEQLQTKR
jgi:hypothetical protein